MQNNNNNNNNKRSVIQSLPDGLAQFKRGFDCYLLCTFCNEHF